MQHHANPTCLACRKAYNQINGRYCLPLARIVEYAAVPPCLNKQNTQAK